MQKFDDDSVISPKFSESALESLKAMKPFIDYLNEVAPG